MCNMKIHLAPILSLWLTIGSALAGPSPHIFVIESIGLDPDTFILTLVVQVKSGQVYAVQAHDGPSDSTNAVVWTTIGTQTASGPTLTFVDDLSGSLSYAGKTYRGVIGGSVYTVNEGYIGYPFLTNPVVRFQSDPISNTIPLQYSQGIYSNTVPVTLSTGPSAAFFRMWSPDNDPKHATIQMSTDRMGAIWTDCATK